MTHTHFLLYRWYVLAAVIPKFKVRAGALVDAGQLPASVQRPVSNCALACDSGW